MCIWSLVFICSYKPSAIHYRVISFRPLYQFWGSSFLEIPGSRPTAVSMPFIYRSHKEEPEPQRGCMGVMFKNVYIYVSLNTHVHTWIIRQRDEAFWGERQEEGCKRRCKVIICVCFERWMNGVKIALICRGTVLPSGLMSAPGWPQSRRFTGLIKHRLRVGSGEAVQTGTGSPLSSSLPPLCSPPSS